MGDQPSLEKTVADQAALRQQTVRTAKAVEYLKANPIPTIDNINDYISRLSENSKKLQATITEFSKTLKEAKLSAFDPLFDQILSVASDVARFKVQDRKGQESLLGAKGFRAALEGAHSSLSAAQQAITPDVISGAPLIPLERAYASALLEATANVAPAILEEPSSAGVEFTQLKDFSTLLLASGAVFTTKLQSVYAEHLDAVRDWLFKHLDQPQTSTHCDLLCKVKDTPLPPRATGDQVYSSAVGMFVSSSNSLTNAVEEVLRSCICDALNPQCPPCDDPGVLLACLTVENCNIKDICNLERDFVLSPTAIRYWIPEIQHLGEVIEKWCCPCPCPDDDAGASVTTESNTSSFLVAARAPGYTGWLGRLIEYGCPRPGVTKGRTIDAFANMAPRMAEALRGIAAPGFGYAADTTMTNMEEKLASISSALESLQREHEKLRAKVDRKKNPEV